MLIRSLTVGNPKQVVVPSHAGLPHFSWVHCSILLRRPLFRAFRWNVSATSVLEALQERPQFRGGPELRDGVELLECRGECVRQAPHRPRLEILKMRIEVAV